MQKKLLFIYTFIPLASLNSPQTGIRYKAASLHARYLVHVSMLIKHMYVQYTENGPKMNI